MPETNILLESGTNELEIVEFYLDEDRGKDTYRGFYGINVAKVLEILQMPELTDMPEVSHPAVLGAFNLRDEIIPLIDLAGWLNKKRVEKEVPKIIVTEFNRTKTAFLVSGVTRIHRINWKEVEAPTGYVSSLTVNSITGVVKISNRIIFILDMEKITAALNPDQAPVEEPAESVKQEIEQRRIKALVADDSTMARKMIVSILQKAGIHVHSVENGELALHYLNRCKKQALEADLPIQDYVDIIVSDIEMPIMDGHTLTRQVKEDPFFHGVPIVLCSSIITETLHHKGIAVGADDQVSKAELNELVNKVYKLIQHPTGSGA